MSERDVVKLLASIAAADGEMAAPDLVGARVMAAFRARRATRERLRFAAWGLAAAAAILTLVTTARRTPDAAIPKPTQPVIANTAARNHENSPAAVRPDHPHSHAPLQQHADGGRVKASISAAPAAPSPVAASIVPAATVPAPAPREMVTEFFPLMDPAPPIDRGAILRVRVPVSAMQAVGLPVREERLNDLVQADVVVGEEGLPRAIRFITVPVR